ncbi:MAG: DUF423 domain-containing protein [Limnospira sp.]
MSRIFLTLASILGGFSVIAGAFGSHSLRGQLSDRALEVFQTGTRYEMYHALALLAVGVLLARSPSPQPLLVAAGWAFVVGVILFSGSLYGLSTTAAGWLGLVTPFGGVILIVGWALLAIGATRPSINP